MRRRGSEPPSRLWQLSPGQRRLVVDALESGAAVTDPALAPVVVEQAERELRSATRWWTVALTRLFGFAALVATLGAMLSGAGAAAAFGLVWTGLWLGAEWVRHRSRIRLAAAVAANRPDGRPPPPS